MKSINYLVYIVSAFAMGLFFVSTIFLSELISFMNFELAIIYIVISAMLYGLCLISDKKSICVIKWMLSALFSYYLIQYFWKTDFAIRALNWFFPETGRQSAGGKFAGMFLFQIQTVIYLICGIWGIVTKVNDYKKTIIIQFIISVLFSGIIVFFITTLEYMFPQMSEIFGG